MIDIAALGRVIDTIRGTAAALDDIAAKLEVDVDELEAVLDEAGIERCPGCDWWVESSELVDEDDDVVTCHQCRKDRDE